jgi:predicted exporter
MSLALAHTLRPMTLGFLTTEGAFAIVAFSGFVGIRQLAIFSLISLNRLVSEIALENASINSCIY